MGVDSSYRTPPQRAADRDRRRHRDPQRDRRPEPRIGRNVRIVNARGVRHKNSDGWAIRDGIVVIPKNSVIPPTAP